MLSKRVMNVNYTKRTFLPKARTNFYQIEHQLLAHQVPADRGSLVSHMLSVCPHMHMYVSSKTKDTLKHKNKHATTLHGAWWVTKFARLVFHFIPTIKNYYSYGELLRREIYQINLHSKLQNTQIYLKGGFRIMLLFLYHLPVGFHLEICFKYKFMRRANQTRQFIKLYFCLRNFCNLVHFLIYLRTIETEI